MSERRDIATELRAEGRRLSGTVIAYGDVAPSWRERFEPGALRMASAVSLNIEHDRLRAVAWTPGGGLDLEDSEEALRMVAEIPPIPAGDVALELVRRGVAKGLSIGFHAEAERREAGLRVIERAELRTIGIVRAPAYRESRVEARSRRRLPLWL
ncbi:MAG: HK97 family phage prohead protease [Rhodospirillales bacterium]|nr:HK97 family phage prohead protease [Rhodospirillales bacterium]